MDYDLPPDGWRVLDEQARRRQRSEIEHDESDHVLGNEEPME